MKNLILLVDCAKRKTVNTMDVVQMSKLMRGPVYGCGDPARVRRERREAKPKERIVPSRVAFPVPIANRPYKHQRISGKQPRNRVARSIPIVVPSMTPPVVEAPPATDEEPADEMVVVVDEPEPPVEPVEPIEPVIEDLAEQPLEEDPFEVMFAAAMQIVNKETGEWDVHV
jgi:hypothetical protein